MRLSAVAATCGRLAGVPTARRHVAVSRTCANASGGHAESRRRHSNPQIGGSESEKLSVPSLGVAGTSAARSTRRRRQRQRCRAAPTAELGDLMLLASAEAQTTFEPQLDPLPAFAFAAVFAAYIAVQLTVRRAINAREAREALEADIKGMKLKQLMGAASIDEMQAAEQALEEAFTEEQRAAEVFVFGEARIRVRVPRPLGAPLEDEDRPTSSGGRATGKSEPRRAQEPRKTDMRPSLLDKLGADSRTPLVAAVTLILLWSLLGLSSDPLAPAPEWMEEMGKSMK